MTAIAVHGAAGRMGRRVIAAVLEHAGVRLVAAIEHVGHAALGQDAGVLAGRTRAADVRVTDDLDAGLRAADVVIDFSTVAATTHVLERCLTLGRPAVVGTTGLDDAANRALAALATRAALVAAPNFSVGVNVLLALARQAVTLAGEDFDLELIEMHHKHKVDAPSGTAARLAEVVAEARGAASIVHGRSGQVGARRPGELGMHALRGGDVVGDHTLVLAGPGERLELTHRAHTREIFARGALRAALWVVGKPAGRYGMADVLGIR